MPQSSFLPPHHPTIPTKKTAVLLVNLGTPDATDVWSIRRYLKEFLSDRRVIEVPALLWWVILHCFILTFRPSKTAKAYRAIWRKESNESPLRYYTRMQAQQLAQDKDISKREDLIVEWAMRYGNPSIDQRLKELVAKGAQRVVVVPLYPQYSATTTATVCDEVFRCLMRMRWQPSLTVVDSYYDHPVYIDALAASVRAHIKSLDWQPDMVIASFHGLPQAYFEAGDPYHCHCQKTGRLLREALGYDEEQFKVTFQSRFGPKAWLEPYTDHMLEALADKGIKKVVVVTPGFASDCVETLEEIAIEGKEQFVAAGGTHFSAVPCLNDSDEGVGVIKSLIGGLVKL